MIIFVYRSLDFRVSPQKMLPAFSRAAVTLAHHLNALMTFLNKALWWTPAAAPKFPAEATRRQRRPRLPYLNNNSCHLLQAPFDVPRLPFHRLLSSSTLAFAIDCRGRTPRAYRYATCLRT